MVSSGIWCLMFARHVVNVAFKDVSSAIQSIPFVLTKAIEKQSRIVAIPIGKWSTLVIMVFFFRLRFP